MPVLCLVILLLTSTVLAAQEPAPPLLPQAAAASWGTVVINADGTVTSWPESATGEAVAVALPGKARQTAVNQYAAYVLLEDGGVVAWGRNNWEALGVSSSTMSDRDTRPTPQPIAGLRDITQIAATYGHGVAVRRDGAVFAWGETVTHLRGEPAPPDNRPRLAPVTQVRALTNIVQVATGARHSLALTRDGRVFAWGENSRGELGSGEPGASSGPVAVVNLTDVTAIAAGGSTSIALKRDGTVWAWGWGQSGMLGTGARPETSQAGGSVATPQQVKGLANVRAIAAGEGHVMALGSDGAVRAWGHDGYGQIGIGTGGGYHLAPVLVKSLSKVTAIGAGGYRSFAVTADGRLWHWGTPIPVSPGRRPNVKLPVVLVR